MDFGGPAGPGMAVPQARHVSVLVRRQVGARAMPRAKIAVAVACRAMAPMASWSVSAGTWSAWSS